MRCPADLERLGPGAIGKELQAAGALAQRDAERARDPGRIEAEHPSRRRGRSEYAAGGGGVEAALVMRAGRQREGEAAGDLVAGDDGGQHVGAARARHLRRGQRGRDHRRAGMQRAGGVGIVEIQRMRERAVQQRRAGGCVAFAVAEHDAAPPGQAECPNRFQQRRSSGRVLARTDDAAEQVEHQQGNADNDGFRQRRLAQARGELGEVAGQAHGKSLRLLDVMLETQS